MDKWENRDRKVSTRRQNRVLSKPFKKKRDSQIAQKKQDKMRIKQAQKDRQSYLDDRDEEGDINN